MNSSIAQPADATTDGTKEEKSSVRVTDKRGASVSDVDLVMAGDPDTRFEDNMKIELVEPEVNPIDALLERTFNFIISQPEWYAVLQMPRQARKELGRNFGKLLTRFPHFNKLR